MKNFMKTFAVAGMLAAVFMVFNTVSAQNSEGYYIGKAHAEVGSCVGQAHGGGPSQIQASVYTTSICFVSGNTTRVDFYQVFGVPCNPSQNPCPRPFVRLVATVDFGCDDEVIGSVCY